MYRIAVIDDEPLVSLGINALIHHKELNLINCGQAYTGEDGVALILRDEPDIVILDIEMPNMDGLRVIQQTREKTHTPPLFLILTNHSEFNYIQSALRLGVFDFIMKIEINEVYLNEVLAKAIIHLEQSGRSHLHSREPEAYVRAMNLERMFNHLLGGWRSENGEPDKMAQYLGLGTSFQHSQAVSFHLSHPAERAEQNTNQITASLNAMRLIHDSMKQRLACHTMLWTPSSIVTFIDLGDCDITPIELGILLVHIKEMTKRYINIDLVYGIGSVCHRYDEIPQSFQDSLTKAREQLPQYATESIRGHVQSESTFHLCFYKDAFAKAFSENDHAAISLIFDEIIEEYMGPVSHLCEALSICFSVLHHITTTVNNSRLLFDRYDPMEELRAIATPEQARNWMYGLERRIIAYFEADLQNTNRTVERIIHYVYNHPLSDLSLSEVSEHFDISPQYISNIFSKFSALTFSDHVRMSKMKHAKLMLAGGGSKVTEVSDALGYSDPYYFSKVFKKTYGISPRGFLLSLLQN